MDWDTYQKEIGDGKDNYEKGFDDGAKANQKRLQPIIDYIIAGINGKQRISPTLDIKSLLEEAGEL